MEERSATLAGSLECGYPLLQWRNPSASSNTDAVDFTCVLGSVFFSEWDTPSCFPDALTPLHQLRDDIEIPSTVAHPASRSDGRLHQLGLRVDGGGWKVGAMLEKRPPISHARSVLPPPLGRGGTTPARPRSPPRSLTSILSPMSMKRPTP